MLNPVSALSQYLAKLERRGALADEERHALLSLHGEIRIHENGDTIVEAGSKSTHCVVLGSGVLSRSLTLKDRSRSTVSFHVPGDAVDLQCLLFKRADHAIESHGPSKTYWIPHEAIFELTENYPVLGRALWLDTLVDASIVRMWAANLGARRARERIVHLLLELAMRFDAIGMLTHDRFSLPVTQSVLAEACGLSLVHLNKSLKGLERDGFLANHRFQSFGLNKKADLIAMVSFNASYLHIYGTDDAVPELAL